MGFERHSPGGGGNQRHSTNTGHNGVIKVILKLAPWRVDPCSVVMMVVTALHLVGVIQNHSNYLWIVERLQSLLQNGLWEYVPLAPPATVPSACRDQKLTSAMGRSGGASMMIQSKQVLSCL